jgi:hypothetical protein
VENTTAQIPKQGYHLLHLNKIKKIFFKYSTLAPGALETLAKIRQVKVAKNKVNHHLRDAGDVLL